MPSFIRLPEQLCELFFLGALYLPPGPRWHGPLIRPQAAPCCLGLALVQSPQVADGQLAEAVIHPGEARADERVLYDKHVLHKNDTAHLSPVALALLRGDDFHGLVLEHLLGQGARLFAKGLAELRAVDTVDAHLVRFLLLFSSPPGGDTVAVMDRKHFCGEGVGCCRAQEGSKDEGRDEVASHRLFYSIAGHNPQASTGIVAGVTASHRLLGASSQGSTGAWARCALYCGLRRCDSLGIVPRDCRSPRRLEAFR